LRSHVVATSEVEVQELDDVADASDSEASIGDATVGLARLAELALAEARMSLTQYRLLHYLRRGRTIQSDLAFQLAVTKHAITRKGEHALDRADELLERYLMLVLQEVEDDADVELSRRGIEVFGRAKRASYGRVRPDGIVPGPKRRRPPERRA